MEVQLFQTICWKDYFFLIVKDQLTILMWVYFWALYSFLLIYLLIYTLANATWMWGRSGCDICHPIDRQGGLWLARRGSPSSLTAPRASLRKLRIWSKRKTIPHRGGTSFFGQGYLSSCASLLGLPNKLSRARFFLICFW